MQITETLNEGLQRNLEVVVPAVTLDQKLKERLNDARSKVNLKGFRPGKVPLSYLQKMYGRSIFAEMLEELIGETIASTLEERKEKVAAQPQVKLTEDQAEFDAMFNGKMDLKFSMSYEVLPEIDLDTLPEFKLTRQIANIPAEEVEAEFNRIVNSARTYKVEEKAAADGDRVTIDYVGKLDGEAFEGGADNDAKLVLGSNSFIKGFEEQLVGLKAGDEREINVTFPEDYQAEHLAGKAATFEIKVKQVEAAEDLVIDDELAKKFGVETIEKLREEISRQIESHYGSFTRQKLKRQLLDLLDDKVKFAVPQVLVDQEFNGIWQQVTAEMQRAGQTFEAENTTEEEQRTQYLALAERRVRLGLLFAEYAQKHSISVSEQELQGALWSQVQQYPGHEKEIFELYQKEPKMIDALRAPILEDKVIDALLVKGDITDIEVAVAQLTDMDYLDADAAPAKKADKPKADKPKAAKRSTSTKASGTTKGSKAAKESSDK